MQYLDCDKNESIINDLCVFLWPPQNTCLLFSSWRKINMPKSRLSHVGREIAVGKKNKLTFLHDVLQHYVPAA